MSAKRSHQSQQFAPRPAAFGTQPCRAGSIRIVLVAPQVRRAFSLIEVLLAIFILGIGVISIAALFPAGIAQQRLTVDDLMGPIVANNAIEIIRSKVKPDDFGTFEQFGVNHLEKPRPTVVGDWTWLRPSFLFDDDNGWPGGGNPAMSEKGAIDIFSFYYYQPTGIPAASRATEFPGAYGVGAEPLYGIPFNTVKYGAPSSPSFNPPRILITQAERYYPMISRQHSGMNDPYKPQYMWDCMFRRFDGKIYVAIFVYRVTIPGGGSAADFFVPPNQTNGAVPPVPIALNFISGQYPNWADANQDVSAGGPWDVGGPDPTTYEDDAIVIGVQAGIAYNPDDDRHAWQEPRQWIIDQNNNVHRVLGQTREDYDNNQGDILVELVRPLAQVYGWKAGTQSLPTVTPYFYRHQTLNSLGNEWYDWVDVDVVTDIWYMPLTMKYDSNGDGIIDNADGDVTITPVYATVKEL